MRVFYCLVGMLTLIRSVHSDSSTTKSTFTAVCRAYCDGSGNRRGGQLCQSHTKEVFCCGQLTARYCCTRPEEALQSQPEEVTSCSNSKWWENNWQALLGLMGAVVALVAITTTCYYCCLHFAPKSPRSRGPSMRITYDIHCNSITTDYNVDGRSRSFCFNPESPNAFDPPAYVLSANPPSYLDSLPDGFRNLAFMVDEETGSNSEDGSPFIGGRHCVPVHDILSATGEPPPAYSNSGGYSRTTRRHSCAVPKVTISDISQGDGKRRSSLGSESVEAIPPPPRFMRRRSTTCISPNFNSNLPPNY